MAAVTTSEFVRSTSRTEVNLFTPIEHRGLLARLSEEVSRAAGEFLHDPAGFVRGILSGDTRDARRRRLMWLGLGLSVIVYSILLVVIVVAGWHRLLAPVASPGEELVKIAELPRGSEPAKPERPPGDDAGGGGGGQHDPRPVSKGPLPQFAPLPQIVQPNPSTIETPSLQIPSTLAGPETAPPPPGAQLGDPKGKPGDFSAGPGDGGGMGNTRGQGVGVGDGPGANRGSRGGPGGTDRSFGSDDGRADLGLIDWRRPPANGYVPFSWIRRAQPVVTPEAQAKGVAGTVLVRATLHADGRITDIVVVNRVEFMTESAIEALTRSTFRPATFNGKPITLTNVLLKVEVHY